jgi:hypothetical protein
VPPAGFNTEEKLLLKPFSFLCKMFQYFNPLRWKNACATFQEVEG